MLPSSHVRFWRRRARGQPHEVYGFERCALDDMDLHDMLTRDILVQNAPRLEFTFLFAAWGNVLHTAQRR